jgi:hypothetical protein
MLREFFRRPTVLWLVLSDVWPLFGVLFLGWTVRIPLALYCLEALVMGLFFMAKILTNRTRPITQRLIGAPLFGGLYFVLVGLEVQFVLSLLYPPRELTDASDFVESLLALGRFADDIGWPLLGWSLLLMGYSHLLSFVRHYLHGPGRDEEHDRVVLRSSGRVIAIVLVVFFGMLLAGNDSWVGFALMLTSFKLGSDLLTHGLEHRRHWAVQQRPAPPAAPPRPTG